ncbi:hypothetical protein HK098_005480 [Nowakowskiella sp. JEL0407]|nr:hypothetical protein HK098_005480 [Nowakowskiella sp. JEL0407]
MTIQRLSTVFCLLLGITSSLATPIALKNSTQLERRGGVNWNPELWANGCDWNGGDIRFVYTSSEQCGPTCAADASCTHFSWSKYEGKCWLKSGLVYPDQAFTVADQSTVCGMVGNVNFAGKEYASGCDWIGNDVGSVAASQSELCFNACKYPSCTHFTWTTANGGTCWLKGGVYSPTTTFLKFAYKSRDQSSVCSLVAFHP